MERGEHCWNDEEGMVACALSAYLNLLSFAFQLEVSCLIHSCLIIALGVLNNVAEPLIKDQRRYQNF